MLIKLWWMLIRFVKRVSAYVCCILKESNLCFTSGVAIDFSSEWLLDCSREWNFGRVCGKDSCESNYFVLVFWIRGLGTCGRSFLSYAYENRTYGGISYMYGGSCYVKDLCKFL